LQIIPGFLSLSDEHIIAVLVISIVLILPVCGAGINDAKGSLDPSNECWKHANASSHTPDTGMDYNRIYDAPKSGETFQYPDTAYGLFMVGLW